MSHEVLQAARRDMRNAMRLKAACRVAIVAFIAAGIWWFV
jgi:hypothetical protein